MRKVFAFLLVLSVGAAPRGARADAQGNAATRPAIPTEDGLYLVLRIIDRPEPGLLPLTTDEGPIWVEVGERQTSLTGAVESASPANDKYTVSYRYPRRAACGHTALRIAGEWRFKRSAGSDSLTCYPQDDMDAPASFATRMAAMFGTTPVLWRVSGERITGTFTPAKPVFLRGETAEIVLTLRNPPDAPRVSRLDEAVAWGPAWDIQITRDGRPVPGMSRGGNRRERYVPFPPGTSADVRIQLGDWMQEVPAPGRYTVTLSHFACFPDGGGSNRGACHTFTGNVSFDISPTVATNAVPVTGRVAGPADLVAAVRTVMLTGNAPAERAVVRADGTFAFPVVPPGTYRIYGVPDRLAPAKTVVIGERAPAEVVLDIPRQAVSGRVRVEGGGPMPSSFTLSFRHETFVSDEGVRLGVRPRPDGTFDIELPRGRWAAGVSEGLPPGTALRTLTYGAADLLRDPLVVGDADRAPLEVTIGRFTPAPMSFVTVEPGDFMMGCATDTPGCEFWERPAHRVRIPKRFDIGTYEVTQQQWVAVMTSNPSRFRALDRPVECVSWNDVQEFLRRLNALTDGYRYRLPTEAEWEYVARAGTAGPVAGSVDALGWIRENSSDQTHPVGTKTPNAWGLHDTYGNVTEWTDDVYAHYEGATAAPVTDVTRVIRGGAWNLPISASRLSLRSRADAGHRHESLGFRIVRESVP